MRMPVTLCCHLGRKPNGGELHCSLSSDAPAVHTSSTSQTSAICGFAQADFKAEYGDLPAKSEEELNAQLGELQHRITHESVTLNEEKAALARIKKLEASREKVRLNICHAHSGFSGARPLLPPLDVCPTLACKQGWLECQAGCQGVPLAIDRPQVWSSGCVSPQLLVTTTGLQEWGIAPGLQRPSGSCSTVYTWCSRQTADGQ